MLRIAHKQDHRPGLDVYFRSDALRTSLFSVSRLQFRGALWDEFSLDPTDKSLDWFALRINLLGRVRVENPSIGHEFASGTVFLGQGFPSVRMRAAPEHGRNSDLLALAIRRPRGHGPVGVTSTYVASRAVLEAARLVAEGLEHEPNDAVLADRVCMLATMLQVDGIAHFHPQQMRAVMQEPHAAADREFAKVHERVLFPLSRHPGMVDIARELGVGERQANRRASQYFERYHVVNYGWQDYVSASRLTMASMLASVPGLPTRTIATLSGFRSASSLCHAFRLAQWHSPQLVGEALRSGDGLRVLLKAR